MPDKIDRRLPEKIESCEDLYIYLYAAMQLEHSTIPPYLMALYSIRPGTNSDASHVLRVVVVEEMLHLTLAANLLNAVGGKPDLTKKDFVPCYPAYLPNDEHEFEVGVQHFSREAVQTFLKIEQPAEIRVSRTSAATASIVPQLVARPTRATTQLGLVAKNQGYRTIGEFYDAIRIGIEYLHDRMGDKLFSGCRTHQVGPDYYYSGGGEIHEVYDLETAKAAINLIIEQGEGIGGRIYGKGHEHELAHYYRFQQLMLGKYYQSGDTPGCPSGPPLHVDWDAVYPFKPNARLADYPDGSEVRAAAEDFNKAYGCFLALLTRAFTGHPELLIEAVPEMFKLRHKIERLIHNPMPGHAGCNAAPTFEVCDICPAPKTEPESDPAQAAVSA